jgi:hypothetical protein
VHPPHPPHDSPSASEPETRPVDHPGDETASLPEAAEADDAPAQTSRAALYETIGIQLVNAGVLTPAPAFVGEVRAAAGYRVAPREVSVVVTQLARSGQRIDPEAVARLVSEARGDRSQRQQRHAEDWRTLGTLLSLRGLDGSPAGQRAFIGAARAYGGRDVGDHLLLRVALALADLGMALESDTVGKVAKRLVSSAADLTDDDLPSIVQQEVRAMRRAESRQRTRARAQRRTTSDRQQTRNEGARRWRPGGRRRRRIKGVSSAQDRPYE